MKAGCVYSVDDYVTVEKPLDSPDAIPFGISYIASALSQAGHCVDLLVFTPATPVYKTVEKFILHSQPRLICLTAVTTQIPMIKKIAETFKKIDPSIYVILGGHHVSLNPEKSIQLPYVDAICIGEGEFSIIELASQLESGQTPSNIQNLWIRSKKDSSVERNQQRPFQENLDDIPYIDRDMWVKWIANPNKIMAVLAARGCPYRCTYCSNHAMAKIAEGKYLRFRSPQNIIGEIRSLLDKYPQISDIYLELETLGASIKFTYELCEALEEFNKHYSRTVQFGTNLAVTKKIINDNTIFEALNRANIKYVNIGLESGSEKVRKEILRRPNYSNQDLYKFCNRAEDYSIKVNMFVLLGIPGEMLKDFEVTVQCVRECQPQHVFLSIFYPYQGTHLYEMAIKMGVLEINNIGVSGERVIPCLDLPGFSIAQIRREYLMFYYNVYKGKWPLFKIIAHTARSWIFAYPRINAFYRYLTNRNKLFNALKERYTSTATNSFVVEK